MVRVRKDDIWAVVDFTVDRAAPWQLPLGVAEGDEVLIVLGAANVVASGLPKILPLEWSAEDPDLPAVSRTILWKLSDPCFTMRSVENDSARVGDLVLRIPRSRPTASYRLTAWPMRVVIADADALVRCVLHEARGRRSYISELASTGSTPVFVASHVPDEVVLCLEKIADESEPHRSLDSLLHMWRYLGTFIRVVELPIGEYLRPEISSIRRTWPSKTDIEPGVIYGDATDLGTAALAAFLADSVIISGDGVFARHGLSDKAWQDMAGRLVTIAHREGTITAGGTVVVGVGYAGAAGVKVGVRQVRVNPIPAIAIMTGLVFSGLWLHRTKRDRVRRVFTGLGKAAALMLEAFGRAVEERYLAEQELTEVSDPAWRATTVKEECARLLARSSNDMTAIELRDALREGLPTTGAQIDRELAEHPAFSRLPGRRWTLGQLITPIHETQATAAAERASMVVGAEAAHDAEHVRRLSVSPPGARGCARGG